MRGVWTSGYLVDLGLDDEQLYERGRALDGGVDVLQGQCLLAHHVVVLRQEVLHPQEGGGGLLLTAVWNSQSEHSLKKKNSNVDRMDVYVSPTLLSKATHNKYVGQKRNYVSLSVQ